MTHYLLVGDDHEVLGVWTANTELSASRLKLQLALKYPDCETLEAGAEDFESFKSSVDQYDFGDIMPIPD
jgi:hypothetical protein